MIYYILPSKRFKNITAKESINIINNSGGRESRLQTESREEEWRGKKFFKHSRRYYIEARIIILTYQLYLKKYLKNTKILLIMIIVFIPLIAVYDFFHYLQEKEFVMFQN